MSGAVAVIPVTGLPEVRPGDDLVALIAAHADLRSGDVVLVAQKVVSKAEGALVEAREGEDPHRARRRIAHEEARRIVADTPGVLVVETAHGLVCANAGIDGSNAPDGTFVLLPADPDASARGIRDGLRQSTGAQVAVIVTDTFGRPWRRGQTDVAIGLSGLAAIRDERGGTDREGRALEVTEAAVADELAAAADLVRRKADGVPVVIVRGFDWQPDADASLGDLLRPASEDLFARGAGMLARALACGSPSVRGDPLGDDDVEAARTVAERAGAAVAAEHGTASTTLVVEGDRLAAGLVVAALADLGCAVGWRDEDGRLLVEASRQPRGLEDR